MGKLTDKANDLILFVFLGFVWYKAVRLTVFIMNEWILHNAWFGFTFYGIDLRTFFFGWIMAVVYAWLIWQFIEWREYRKWKKKNKHWLRS